MRAATTANAHCVFDMRACYRGPAHRPVTLDHPPQAERLKIGTGGDLTTAINYALYQGGWLACVFGAAWSHPWVGVAIGGLTLATHIMLAEDWGAEFQIGRAHV